MTITVAGARGFGEPVVTSISGSYRDRAGAALPDYAIDMGVRDRGVTLTSVGGRSYLSLGSAAYELPAAGRRLARSSAKGANGLTRTLEQFGIAPWRWEIDKRVGATERVGGVQTVRVDTGVEVVRVLRDANTLAGLLDALGLAAMSIDFAVPRRQRARLGGISPVKVAGQVQITDVGARRSFAAPASPQPYASLRLALDALAEAAGREGP